MTKYRMKPGCRLLLRIPSLTFYRTRKKIFIPLKTVNRLHHTSTLQNDVEHKLRSLFGL